MPTRSPSASSARRGPGEDSVACLLGGLGLADSPYPYVLMDRRTLRHAASATEPLVVIAIGCAPAVPAIAGYTVFAYRVFRGKATALSYR